MLRKVLITALLIGLIGAAWGFYLYKKPRPDLAGIKASISMTAIAVYDSFQNNEAVANSKYLDKIIEVNGVIENVQSTDSTASIQLTASNSGGVNCSLAHYTIKETLPVKGSKILIKGRCTGYLMDVNLVDCVIEKQTP